MPIIITGGYTDLGVDDFTRGLAAGQRLRINNQEEARRQQIFDMELQRAQQFMLQEDARGTQLDLQRQGLTTPEGEAMGQAAMGTAGAAMGALGGVPGVMADLMKNFAPSEARLFPNFSNEQKQEFLQQKALEKTHKDMQGGIATIRGMEGTRLPEGTADLLAQQLAEGKLSQSELDEAVMDATHEEVQYEESVRLAKRMAERMRDEETFRAGDDFLSAEASGIIAELEQAVRIREGNPFMDPIDFESYGKRFADASVPDSVRSDIERKAIQNHLNEMEMQRSDDAFAAKFPDGVFGAPGDHKTLSDFKSPSTDEKRPHTGRGEEPPRGGVVSIKKLKKDNPERLQEVMGAMRQFVSQMVSSGDASTDAEGKKALVAKAAELGIKATAKELEEMMNFEAGKISYPRKDLQKKLGPMAGGRN